MKAGLERRQSDIHHRAIDESHARTENGRSQYPWSRLCATRNRDIPGSDCGFVARRSHAGYGMPFGLQSVLKIAGVRTTGKSHSFYLMRLDEHRGMPAEAVAQLEKATAH